MDKITSFLPLKPDSVGPPKMYLQAMLSKKTFEDDVSAWAISPAKYVQQAIQNIKTYHAKNLVGRYSSLNQTDNPFSCDYAPKEDIRLDD